MGFYRELNWLLSLLLNTVFLCIKESIFGEEALSIVKASINILKMWVSACAVVDIGYIFYDHFIVAS